MNFKLFLEAIALEYHSELNQKLWDDYKLKPIIRDKLLEIAKKYQGFVELEDSQILDILMTGGNANYNYTELSDIDVHLLVDMKIINPTDNPIITEFYQDKKSLWLIHHNVTVLGYSIEPYVQDVNEKAPVNQGVYSLLHNDWIQKPVKGYYDWEHDVHLIKKIEHYVHTIDFILKNDLGSDKMKSLRDHLRNMRNNAISANGEFAIGNLVFKSLRNQGYLDKMNDYVQDKEDKQLSLF